MTPTHGPPYRTDISAAPIFQASVHPSASFHLLDSCLILNTRIVDITHSLPKVILKLDPVRVSTTIPIIIIDLLVECQKRSSSTDQWLILRGWEIILGTAMGVAMEEATYILETVLKDLVMRVGMKWEMEIEIA